MLQQGFADGSTVNASKEKAVRDLNEPVFKKELNVLNCVLQIFQEKCKYE